MIILYKLEEFNCMQIKNNNPDKIKTKIFNFPLSAEDRKSLERTAAIWHVSLAEAIRRSIAISYKEFKNTQVEKTEDDSIGKDSHTKILDAILGIHSELANTYSNVEDISNFITENNSNIAAAISLVTTPVNNTAIKISALINTLSNHSKTGAEAQKNMAIDNNNHTFLSK